MMPAGHAALQKCFYIAHPLLDTASAMRAGRSRRKPAVHVSASQRPDEPDRASSSSVKAWVMPSSLHSISLREVKHAVPLPGRHCVASAASKLAPPHGCIASSTPIGVALSYRRICVLHLSQTSDGGRPTTVFTLRFTTAYRRGAALSEPLAGVNVALIDTDGKAVLHRVPPLSDAADMHEELQELCKVRTTAIRHAYMP